MGGKRIREAQESRDRKRTVSKEDYQVEEESGDQLTEAFEKVRFMESIR